MLHSRFCGTGQASYVKPTTGHVSQRGHQDGRFAVWSDAEQRLSEVRATQGVPCRLVAAASDVVTIMPLAQHGGARFAPIGAQLFGKIALEKYHTLP